MPLRYFTICLFLVKCPIDLHCKYVIVNSVDNTDLYHISPHANKLNKMTDHAEWVWSWKGKHFPILTISKRISACWDHHRTAVTGKIRVVLVWDICLHCRGEERFICLYFTQKLRFLLFRTCVTVLTLFLHAVKPYTVLVKSMETLQFFPKKPHKKTVILWKHFYSLK